MIGRVLRWLFDTIWIDLDNDAFEGGIQTNRATLLVALAVGLVLVALPLGWALTH